VQTSTIDSWSTMKLHLVQRDIFSHKYDYWFSVCIVDIIIIKINSSMSVIDWLKRIKLFNVAYIEFLKCHDNFTKILSLNALTAFNFVFFWISHIFFWILKWVITSRVTRLSSLKTFLTELLLLESVAILLSLWVSVCSTVLRFDDDNVLKLLMWRCLFCNVT